MEIDDLNEHEVARVHARMLPRMRVGVESLAENGRVRDLEYTVPVRDRRRLFTPVTIPPSP